MSEAFINQRWQYGAIALLSLGAAIATGILSYFQSNAFQPYLGNLDPLLAIVLISALGFISLYFLHSRCGFEIFMGRGSWRGVVVSAIIATLFAIAIILIDLSIGFPEDINAPLPQSLLFYPAIAYIAEIVFHTLPLAILLNLLFKPPVPNSFLWLCIVLAALFEPGLQMFWSSAQEPFSWFTLYVGLHILAINFLQLIIFRRYDFVSMYSFRLIYYIHWHIIWGHLRLQWLF